MFGANKVKTTDQIIGQLVSVTKQLENTANHFTVQAGVAAQEIVRQQELHNSATAEAAKAARVAKKLNTFLMRIKI